MARFLANLHTFYRLRIDLVDGRNRSVGTSFFFFPADNRASFLWLHHDRTAVLSSDSNPEPTPLRAPRFGRRKTREFRFRVRPKRFPRSVRRQLRRPIVSRRNPATISIAGPIFLLSFSNNFTLRKY